METFGKIITFLIGLIMTPFLYGWVLFKFWGWFIVTTFPIEPITYLQSIGLILVLNFVKSNYNESTKAKPEEFWDKFTDRIIYVIVNTLLMLFFGWLFSKIV